MLTTLVQYELDESLALVDLEHRERVHLGWAVVEGDAVTQLLAGAALDKRREPWRGTSSEPRTTGASGGEPGRRRW